MFSADITPERLKLCSVTKVNVFFFLVLGNAFNFDLFEFSATILEKGLLQVYQQADSDTFRMYKYKPKTIKLSHSAFILNRTKRRRLQKERQGYK